MRKTIFKTILVIILVFILGISYLSYNDMEIIPNFNKDTQEEVNPTPSQNEEVEKEEKEEEPVEGQEENNTFFKRLGMKIENAIKVLAVFLRKHLEITMVIIIAIVLLLLI